MERKHLLLIAAALLIVFVLGAYFTGYATKWFQYETITLEPSYDIPTDYNTQTGVDLVAIGFSVKSIFIDGVAAPEICGTGDQDSLYCPIGQTLMFHVDRTKISIDGDDICPASSSISLYERRDKSGDGLCAGVPVATPNDLLFAGEVDGLCRYCGTFMIRDVAAITAGVDLKYDPCAMSSTGPVHPTNDGQHTATIRPIGFAPMCYETYVETITRDGATAELIEEPSRSPGDDYYYAY